MNALSIACFAFLPATPVPTRADAARQLPRRPLLRVDLLQEAEAQCALAGLFPHLQQDAMRAIQDLFPLQAQVQAQAREAAVH